MTEVVVVPAQDWHAEVIAADPRPADAQELAAMGTTPLEAMRLGLRNGMEPSTALVDGVPVCMFGASAYSILGGIGVPWLVAARDMDTMTMHKALLRHSRASMDKVRNRFPALLFNAVDERNEAAKRWLAWLGFSFMEPQPMGRNGELFRVFYWRG